MHRVTARVWIIGIFIASVAIYVGGVLFFGQPGTITTTLPIILAGFFFGSRWGVTIGILSYPVNAAAIWVVAGSPAPFLTSAGSVLGTMAAILVGWMVGRIKWLHDDAASERDAARSLLSDSFEYSPVGIAILDVAGRFETANPAFAAMLTRSRDQVIGMNWREISPPREHAESQSRVAALFDGTEGLVEFERTFLTSDGAEHLGIVHLALIPTADKEPLRMLAQITDVTEIRLANKELRGLIDSKDRFLAAVSHELRTPLSVVMGLALEIRDRSEGFSAIETAELAELIAEQSVEMAALVEDFLVHARASYHITVLREPVDLITEAQTALRHTPGFDHADVSLSVGDEQVIVTGDGLRVRQIVRNLVQNALRYGGPEISIAAAERSGRGTLTVTDNGNGVEEQHLERIFEPFERNHTDPGVTESIGIGLHVSRTLARLMGGDVEYRRESGGTSFVLELPLAGDPTGPTQRYTPELSAPARLQLARPSHQQVTTARASHDR